MIAGSARRPGDGLLLRQAGLHRNLAVRHRHSGAFADGSVHSARYRDPPPPPATFSSENAYRNALRTMARACDHHQRARPG